MIIEGKQENARLFNFTFLNYCKGPQNGIREAVDVEICWTDEDLQKLILCGHGWSSEGY